MSSDLLVRMKVPIATAQIVPTAALIFSRWLPLHPSDALVLKRDDIDLRLWFTIESTWWASELKVEDLPKSINVLAHFVYADVTIHGVSDKLRSYIFQRDYSKLPAAEDKALQDELDKLGQRVLDLTLSAYNGLVRFVRARKGQYWLNEYAIDLNQTRNFLTQFEAKVQVEGNRWHRFNPCYDSFTVRSVSQHRYLTPDDWKEAQSFIQSGSRAPLIGSLLAGAEELAGNGHTRSALTEAITGLEVALSRFATKPKAQDLLGADLAARMGVESMKQQVERMGLTGSVSYLLPLLFPETILAADVLAGVREAIQERQNVVHSGAREVNPKRLEMFLRHIIQLCTTLEKYTNEPE